MSCSVCTCTHHAAIHDTSGGAIGACRYQGGCDCAEFEVLDQTAWARKPTPARGAPVNDSAAAAAPREDEGP